MKSLSVLIVCIAFLSCNSSSTNKVTNKQRLDHLLGFWQDENDEHRFICFSYALQDVDKGIAAWGTFPLEVNPSSPDYIDTTFYYRNKEYTGGLQLEQDKITCWYQDMEAQGKRLKGEIKITGENRISTPIGVFRKLTDEDVSRINPNI